MIHYHGTPIGGRRVDAAEFLRGRHALVPFPRQDDLAVVMEVCASFVLDNGAFSIWRRGGVLDVDAYTQWAAECSRHPSCDWALIPDVIDGAEPANDSLLADWPRSVRGVPVYHLHESLDRAERLANEWDTVAIGSSGEWPTPGAPKWWRRMTEVMGVMCDEGGKPRCKLHGLRMLNPAIFSSLPLKSADSTNCGQNGTRNGKAIDSALTSGQGAMITAWRIEAHNSSATWESGAGVLCKVSQRQLFDW